MTHLVQKGSPQYYEMGKRFLGAFVLAAAATTAMGCQGLGTALHNIGQSSSQNLERGWYNITGSDVVCQRQINSTGARNAGDTTSRNDTGRVTQNCIEPQKMTQFEIENRKLELMRAETQAKVMETQAQAQARIRDAEMIRQHEISKRQECQNQERLALQQNRELPGDHVCYKKGYLTNEANSAVQKAPPVSGGAVQRNALPKQQKKPANPNASGWQKFADFMNASE